MTGKPEIFGSIIGLKPGSEEQYFILHRNTFPGVLERIRKSNIAEFSIFHHRNLLFNHQVYTGNNFEADMLAIASDPVTQDWWKLTDSLQVPLEDRRPGEWWTQAELILSLEPEARRKGNVSRYAYTARLTRHDAGFPADELLSILNKHQLMEEITCLHVFRKGTGIYIYVTASGENRADFLPDLLDRERLYLTEFYPMDEVFYTNSTGKSNETKPKVFVTGCFDLLHSGHVAFLQEASSFGEVYVCIGSDANVEQLKGRYPVNSQEERKYLLEALSCVRECRINSGWGTIDFEKELKEVSPDIFVVNEDGHTPAKQQLCHDHGIEYRVLKRIPYGQLPARSTTTLRTECSIPFRIDLAGGWLDQPFVSKHHPGPVITISIEPTLEFNERSGMASSTRRKAIELWRTNIPHGDNEQLARLLFSYENPPGTPEIAGSQDSLGIVLPGLNRLDYDGNYWPASITSFFDEDILRWIEDHLFLVTLGPRTGSFRVLSETRITTEAVQELAQATLDCWNAILRKSIGDFGDAFRRSFEAQLAMFPNMADETILEIIRQYESTAAGWKLSGAGGGGYLILVSEKTIPESIKIKIRRKNSFP